MPPHLSYISALPDITQQLKHDMDELKHQHEGPYSSGHHQQSHWLVANTAVCMRKRKETSLQTPTAIYGVFQKKVAPLKLFGIFLLWLKSFCNLSKSWQMTTAHPVIPSSPITFGHSINFCKFVGNSYPHISTNFCSYLNISSNSVNFSTTTHRFHPLKFWVGLFTQKMKMQHFGNDVIFRHRVS